VTFGIGAALAGASGGLYGMIGHLSPYIGVPLTAQSFVIAVIGGLDNPFSVILAGLVIGMAESLAALYLGPTYANVISFGLLVVILVLRPARAEVGMTRPWVIGLVAAAAILIALVPVFGSAVLIQYGINALIFATLAQSWNIIGGYTGYASFGNSVFFGLGAYGTAIAMTQFGLPFWAGLPLGAVLGVFCAFLLGLPVLRLGDITSPSRPWDCRWRWRRSSPTSRSPAPISASSCPDPRRRHVLRAGAGPAGRLRALRLVDLAKPLRHGADRDPGGRGRGRLDGHQHDPL
jgi:Branched-chain amino acid ABC-type transport system, permease components